MMLSKFYILLGRVFYYLTSPGLFVLSHVLPARTRLVLCDARGRVLLVRNWFGTQCWALPGGGAKFSETPVQAVRREILEELSLDLPEAACTKLGLLGRYDALTPFSAHVFTADLPEGGTVRLRRFELLEHYWADADQLPPDTHASVVRALALLES